MPEYLAPGVYVEETSFRARSIEGVSTSTTGFVGATRRGPYHGAGAGGEAPELLTSFADFERIYGGLEDLAGGPNYMAHAVRAYYENGGSRLFVSRAFTPTSADPPTSITPDSDGAARSGFGLATSANVVDAPAADDRARFVARFAGASGNGQVTAVQVTRPASLRSLDAAPEGSMLREDDGAGAFTYYLKTAAGWVDSAAAALDTSAWTATGSPNGSELVSMVAEVRAAGEDDIVYDDLHFDRAHPRWIGHVLAEHPQYRADALQNPFGIQIGGNVTAFALRTGLLEAASGPTFALTGGNDGAGPTDASYQTALQAFESIDDISIVAAPDAAAVSEAVSQAVNNHLISHAERRGAYRIAVLDVPPRLTATGALQARSVIDSTYAALYYPWVVIRNPLARPGRANQPEELAVPASGAVCGIYARNDVERGVFKAPANEVVRGAVRFAQSVSFGQQELLNPAGVNCLRSFPGRGHRVWGARTASSDPEFKYVNVRRYFNYLERSIDQGTQWVVFEPNGERLWGDVRETVASFLYNEWVSGALLGEKAEQAYFVRCDRSTMTQNDLDNGRLICLVGVAVVKPAEFVIFRIGQKTANSTS